ncbi:tetratricopeptide repeat-containing diguanylate cyclase [Evansella cellulosilytica]|uniref:Diguanylate cyclase n=1 Tax=Evansella cellulosilytica (strain ATCC 21833 / DSM 2522 / FERM P-1141 / JCM 9156 / N-4) TaxID=649639 RepID=E6TQA7_EVAC2|nr:GGDEF domain-containing protein [Evansella cellulosilytica]ADU29285.1 diguanylate cyclase [Evansella cellulosilytica DSM 2522]
MHSIKVKKSVEDYGVIASQYESEGQGRRALAYRLLEAKKCYREGLFSDAQLSIGKALDLYKKYVNEEPPVCVQLLYGHILEKNGNLKQALTTFYEIYTKHNKIIAFIRTGYISINLRDLSLLKKYESTCIERIHSSSVSLQDKLHLQVILGYFYSYTRRDTSIVNDMIQYHKNNNTKLREKLKKIEYIRWIYNLHILQLLNNFPWNERCHLIFEAESLAEQYEETTMLMNIYNLIGIGLLEENVIKAKDYMIKSKDLAIKLANKHHEMNANTNLFMFYQYLGETSHAIKLADRAKAIGEKINSNFNEINLVKLYYLIEDYDKALKLINEIKPKVRRIHLTMTRVDALVFQYKIMLKQHDVKKAKRLWPFIEKMSKKHKNKAEHLLLQCQYYTLFNRYDKSIYIAKSCLEEGNLSVEERLEFSIMLLEALMKLNKDEAFTEYIQSFEELVYNKGYFGYLGYVYYLKGLFYEKNESYIQARVHFIRARSYFTKVNNQLKQKEMCHHIESVDSALLHSPSNRQVEMMNLLTKNEIIFDSMRLVHSAKTLEDVCKNIVKVLHENIVFDHTYFHFRMGRLRTKTLHVSDKLQSKEISNEKVDIAMKKVMEEKKVCHIQSDSSHLYGFPIISDENEVVCVVLIDNQNVLFGEYVYSVEQFLQMITPKIEKVIMQELVHVDHLTKLYNRNYFTKRLEEEFQKCVDYDSDLSFIMIDIDNFSYVNNQYGHAEGDRILEQVAKGIQQSVRSGDIVGRYGGEELIVILPNTNANIAKGVANRILSDICNIHINDMYQITASIGVSTVDKDSPMTVQELIDKADIAERYAKEHGKNQVSCYWEIAGE